MLPYRSRAHAPLKPEQDPDKAAAQEGQRERDKRQETRDQPNRQLRGGNSAHDGTADVLGDLGNGLELAEEELGEDALHRPAAPGAHIHLKRPDAREVP